MTQGLHAIVGTEGVYPVSELYELGQCLPATVVAPASEAEVAALIEYAIGTHLPFVVAGGTTHLSALLPPEGTWWVMSTARLKGVVDYSPADLVITLRSGTTLAEAQQVLAEHYQYLPWNPPLPEQATIGGIVASNRAGSWRFRFGTPRDPLLAVRAVRGDGVAFKSGAKVVKSVAGYDIHRLLCGSWGTLSVLTEITLKVYPLPRVREAVGWYGEWETLEPTLAELLRSPLRPDGISVIALKQEAPQEDLGFALEALLPTGTSLPLTLAPQEATETLLPDEGGESLCSSFKVFYARPAEAVQVQAPPLASTVVLERPPQVESPLQIETLPKPEEALAPLPMEGSERPFLLLEFSGNAGAVEWQINWLLEHGYPALPVELNQVEYLRDLLAPRRHALMVQLLMRSSEVAHTLQEVIGKGFSAIAYPGSGVLYLWSDDPEKAQTLVDYLQHTSHRWRVLQMPYEAQRLLPPIPLSPGERLLMRQIKAALDPHHLLPVLPGL